MNKFVTVLALAGMIVFIGCSGTDPATYVDYDFSFGYLERVAVVPFENLTNDPNAGAKVTRYFTSGLLSAQAFEVIEPGEVSVVLQKFALFQTAELTTDQIISIGRELKVQGLVFGSVSESATNRSGSNSTSTVSLVVRMVETESGATVWSTAQTTDNSGFWSSVFGTPQKSLSEVTRDCVDECLDKLFD